ncbi:hypothetical protein HNQ94_001453 [Salirhabdus euzebyi]|uniref:Uncharacterized protein n=1 Tax=Salirhabdus euzebyi TaxID=394506 RepID=A0A841Q3P0_9BACI|nr:hypothetical protein [Salirhabdus euzebyi]MBB6453005.1 hypothetical protein [Salirhabdus euzebyi]
MKNTVSQYVIIAFAGWLLVQVSSSIERSFSYFLEAYRLGVLLSNLVALAGWLLTVIFVFRIILIVMKKRA